MNVLQRVLLGPLLCNTRGVFRSHFFDADRERVVLSDRWRSALSVMKVGLKVPLARQFVPRCWKYWYDVLVAQRSVSMKVLIEFLGLCHPTVGLYRNHGPWRSNIGSQSLCSSLCLAPAMRSLPNVRFCACLEFIALVMGHQIGHDQGVRVKVQPLMSG